MIGHTSYRDVIRVKRHTGKTNSSGDNPEATGESKADYSFKQIPKDGAYPRDGNYGVNNAVPHDVAIATPTLEVGVDMSNVSDVLTHKAIRNVSSYRQKVGRAGREPGTDSVAMTLMSHRRQEFQHSRSMFRLVDAEILDPVPVANNNLAMLRNEAYECTFDYIARSGHKNWSSSQACENQTLVNPDMQIGRTSTLRYEMLYRQFVISTQMVTLFRLPLDAILMLNSVRPLKIHRFELKQRKMLRTSWIFLGGNADWGC